MCLRLRDVHRPDDQHLLSSGYADGYSLTRVFIIFVVVLVLAAVLNIFSSHLMAIMNNVSVWWHVVGARDRDPDPDLRARPRTRAFSYVFTERFNNSGYGGGSTSGVGFWFAIVPFGFLLTQYTITGFDASAHLSEETHGAADGGGQGHLAVDLLLGDRRLHPAARVRVRGAGRRQGQPDNALAAAASTSIFAQALGTNWAHARAVHLRVRRSSSAPRPA